MKILIPVEDDKSSKNKVAQGFHNADYACIYDCENKSYEWLLTKEIATESGNLSVQLKRKGVLSVISYSMSFMALGLFTESGLKVYKAKGKLVDENVKLFLENRLEDFSAHYTSMTSECSSSCSSCKSSCS